MTNRPDLLDTALTRPGRMEVKLEIGLPNEFGRQQIFKIHTKSMMENNLLDDDVDINWLAQETNNYTGAEIEAVCRSAGQTTLFKDHEDITKALTNNQAQKQTPGQKKELRKVCM